MHKKSIVFINVISRRAECINKDFMGGYGWAFNAGNSLPARLINIVKKRGENIPLISFGYLAALFKSHGHDVSYHEADSSATELPKADIAFLTSSMVDYRNEISLAARLRDAGIKVGFIGVFASVKPELFMPSCTFVIRGEPEDAARRIAQGEEFSGIIDSPPVLDLDLLPFPDWKAFPFQKFSYLPVIKEKPFFPLLSSRGCAFKCGYCPYTVFYTFRTRSVENVVEEISGLIRDYGMRGMLFRDPLFTGNKQRAAQIAEGLLNRNMMVRWACETRLDLLDEDLLRLFYRSGCRVINVGVESSNPSLLANVNRKLIDRDQQKRIVDFADQIGIRITAFYVLGLPGETPQTVEQTILYAKWLNTHVAQFFINTPFPGTPEFDRQRDDIVESDWEQFDCYTPVLRYERMTRSELLSLKEKAFVSYYYRPKYLWHFLRRTGRALVHG